MITAEMFRKATGSDPVQDDLERANCLKAGEPGHYHCGWNSSKNLPYFMTGRREDNDQERTTHLG
jgi:hypothetical protein